MKALSATLLYSFLVAAAAPAFASETSYVFGTQPRAASGQPVGQAPYSPATGFGFEGTVPRQERTSAGGSPFLFSRDVPEGNYRVTVTFGGDRASNTTVKAELRRLMLERVAVPAGGSVTRSFIVNVRTPDYPGGRVRLKVPREAEAEARAWDARITLEFDGDPAVRAIRFEPVSVPTLYILGDSTVADQSGEPYASWGQMLPRFLKPTVAVANHSESGETTFSSVAAHRFDKILSLIRPGDYFMVQFGHNDQKSRDPDAATRYRENLTNWARQIKAKGATPIIVTSMYRNRFAGDRVVDTLGVFPEEARKAAAATGALLIDLHAQSARLYEALGPRGTLALFMHDASYTKKDGTHHGPYGAYELAKIIAQALRVSTLPIASAVADDLAPYNPARPMPESSFKVPASVTNTTERPLGDGRN